MKCHCEKCGYDWESRFTRRPKACPDCKYRHWDVVYVLTTPDGRYVDGAGNEIPRELVEGAVE
jgi:hypothetical protein